MADDDAKYNAGSTTYPSKTDPCYDCGSTIANHHTTLCDLAGDQIRDLPCVPGTQYWTKAKKPPVKK